MATKKTLVTAAAGIAALGAGLGIAGLASADPTASPTPSATSTASGAPSGKADPRGGGGPGRGGHGDHQEALAKELATKLGLDEAKVADALKAVREENRPTTKPTPGTAKPDRSADDAALAKALAGKLGVDEAKVKTALDEIRAARATERTAALKTKLDTAVKAGTLTQAEADAVAKAVDKGVINVGPR
ncbi:MAG TPA: hypothetical protein VIT20_01885 [Propionibacteriaceae bacterium]